MASAGVAFFTSSFIPGTALLISAKVLAEAAIVPDSAVSSSNRSAFPPSRRPRHRCFRPPCACTFRAAPRWWPSPLRPRQPSWWPAFARFAKAHTGAPLLMSFSNLANDLARSFEFHALLSSASCAPTVNTVITMANRPNKLFLISLIIIIYIPTLFPVFGFPV